MAKDIKLLLESLNIEYKNIELYKAAFTHVSYRNEHKSTCFSDYDRLEFIGDGVLDLLIADLVYHRYPEMHSGELSKCRSSLVMGTTLSSFATKLGFDEYVLLSKGEEKNEKINPKILEDIFEAFIGAYYLDNNNDFNKVKSFVFSFFTGIVDNYQKLEEFDYKSKLQETLQASGKGDISYVVVKEEGTAQNKHFEIEVRCSGLTLGLGKGSSKKKAEQDAAKNALDKKV